MDERQILAQLLMRGQGQGMGSGNPTADYLGDRSTLKSIEATANGVAAPMVAGTGLGAMATGNIPLGLAMLLGGGVLGVGSAVASDQSRRYGDGSDMWANRFGNGDPSQGMPGTPSGPAWRR